MGVHMPRRPSTSHTEQTAQPEAQQTPSRQVLDAHITVSSQASPLGLEERCMEDAPPVPAAPAADVDLCPALPAVVAPVAAPMPRGDEAAPPAKFGGDVPTLGGASLATTGGVIGQPASSAGGGWPNVEASPDIATAC
jgi:hypothetical protein